MWEYQQMWDRRSLNELLSTCEEMGGDGWELISVTHQVDEIERESFYAEHDNYPVRGRWVAVLKRKKSS